MYVITYVTDVVEVMRIVIKPLSIDATSSSVITVAFRPGSRSSRGGPSTGPWADGLRTGLHGLSPRGSLVGNAVFSTVVNGVLS